MGKEHLQQGGTDLRKIIVQLEMHTGCEQRETLEKTLDVRIFTAIRFQGEARGQPGIFLGELGPHLAHVGKLALVIIQKVFPDRRQATSPHSESWWNQEPCQCRLLQERGPSGGWR